MKLKKKCNKCGEEKLLNEYHKNKLNKDGYMNICKVCVLSKNRKVDKPPKNYPPLTITEKYCTVCKLVKPVGDFNRCITSKDGLQYACRLCHNARNKLNTQKRYAYHPRTTGHYLWNENGDVTHKLCPRCNEMKPANEFYSSVGKYAGLSTYCKICNSLKNTEYYAVTAEKQIEASREYRAKHPNEVKSAVARYHATHKPEIATTMLKWQRNNRSKVSSYKKRRRAQKKNVLNTLDDKQWLWLLGICNYICVVDGCGKPFEHQDHVIPLDPGTHTLDNVQPLCQTHNLKKNRTYIDYRSDSLRRKVRKYMRSIELTPLTKKQWDGLISDFNKEPSLKKRQSRPKFTIQPLFA